MSKFYITTPIYYVNDKPHIGHAGSFLFLSISRLKEANHPEGATNEVRSESKGFLKNA